MSSYQTIGLMSGTSLDGVDIAFCEFTLDRTWKFKILGAETIGYDESWKKKLSEIHSSSAEDISALDSRYGSYLGKLVREFCERNNFKPLFISSHGHTIFHNPTYGYTRQIGSGAHIAAHSGFPVVCDFRSADVALGGQGAPLVPVGDKLLFPDAAFCLNLGGIANISFDSNGERIAYDICACNLVLNYYSMKIGHAFDRGGQLASKGTFRSSLLHDLNELPYYRKGFPKSLGREDVERDVLQLIDGSGFSEEDVLNTFCEHIAEKIAQEIESTKLRGSILVTGGGAWNDFLINRLRQKCNNKIEVPEKEIIDFKEAVIFAFLGVLRMRNEINCLKSVTGAGRNSCGGAIYEP